MLFRLFLLLLVCFLGCIVFYARRGLEPQALLRMALTRGALVSLYVALAYGGMQLATRFFIDA